MSEKNTVCIAATHGKSLINFRGQLIKMLVTLGNRVVCISIEENKECTEAVEQLGAEYRQVKGTRTGMGVFSALKMIINYWKIYKEVGATHCFLYMSKPVSFGGLAAIFSKVPHINILVNGLENAYYRKSIKDSLVRIVMSASYKIVGKHSDNIFFQNHDDYQYFVNHNLLVRDNACIIHGSGVDMSYFSREPLPENPIVLMIARLLWSKGIREFFTAIKTLKKKNPNVKVILVGGLDENDEALKPNELNTLQNEANIEYIGHVDDVRPYLKECSIFVLPSYHEGLPRSVLEAMATGRPIITTLAPGCRETVIDGKTGFLVPIGDSHTLEIRIEQLVEDADLRKAMANESYELCKRLFDVNKINAIIIKKMMEGK